jgi:nicotinamide-nucleotide amidase
MSLRAEIISIGDELTSGQRLDTNSRWLSERIGDLGVKTVFHTTVGDTLTDNIDAFRTATRRADIVIASGGLGPTADDLTREAISKAFDAPLEMRQEAMDHIVSLFARRQRPMPERNQVQAMFPMGSRIIDNPHGTAPGIDLSVNAAGKGSRIFALPGVPAEMMEMYRETVEKRLVDELGVGRQRWYYYSLKVFGIGESDVEKRLPDLIHRDRDPLVGITVSKATITLRIAALCESETEFQSKIIPTVNAIRDELGPLVFGEGEMDIDEATDQLLRQRGLRLGVIEVGAGAWIQQSLARLADDRESSIQAAQWYPSMVSLEKAYSTKSISKEERGSGTHESLDSDKPVSDTERQLAQAAQTMLAEYGLDLCLAACTYPSWSTVRDSKSLPFSDFTMALARAGKPTQYTTTSLGAHPDVLYHRLLKAGLNFLRLELLQDA